jgi:exodeoxyribonuclease-3
MRIASWNVNGVRAVIKKDFDESVNKINADIICLQETKAQDDQVAEAIESTVLKDYYLYSNSAVKKGYSGTAIISKQKPLSVEKDMGIEEHDQEGRVLCAEYDNFYLVTVYVPNSKSDLSRLDYRKKWDADFLNYLKALEAKKEVIVCGDFNVAHKEIDLARPKSNYNKSAGFTQTEIDGMDNFTQNGFLDTFRKFYPDVTDSYTWWSYRAGARAKNIGWRIDYFLTSEKLENNLKDALIFHDVLGSDHCPIAIDI